MREDVRVKMNPTAMVGAACAGMFCLLVGAGAMALVLTAGRGSIVGSITGAFIAVYLIVSGLWKIGTALDAAGNLEDALDRPGRES